MEGKAGSTAGGYLHRARASGRSILPLINGSKFLGFPKAKEEVAKLTKEKLEFGILI